MTRVSRQIEVRSPRRFECKPVLCLYPAASNIEIELKPSLNPPPIFVSVSEGSDTTQTAGQRSCTIVVIHSGAASMH